MTSLHYRYQTLQFGDLEIHVRSLRDIQQFSDPDDEALQLGISSAAWPLFGMVWASGEALAELMATYNAAGKRILEVGSGLGLASLVLNHRNMDITATDIHPEAETFLQENARINQDQPVPFLRSDWSNENTGLGLFDLIIGSDLLYERSHVIPLSGFIDRHAAAACKVVLVDPGRGHHAPFSKRMVSLGYSHWQERTNADNPERIISSGRVLHYRLGAGPG